MRRADGCTKPVLSAIHAQARPGAEAGVAGIACPWRDGSGAFRSIEISLESDGDCEAVDAAVGTTDDPDAVDILAEPDAPASSPSRSSASMAAASAGGAPTAA